MDSEDPKLWKIENFLAFLDARKSLLAAEVNRRMEELLHGDNRWLSGSAPAVATTPVLGGISSEEEEQQLEDLNGWVEENGLKQGTIAFELADPATGEQRAVFDLAWPNGIQEELSQPVVVLLNETSEVLAIASQAGYRCFTAVDEFKKYVTSEILMTEEAA